MFGFAAPNIGPQSAYGAVQYIGLNTKNPANHEALQTSLSVSCGVLG